MGKKSLSQRNDLVKTRLSPDNDMTGRDFGEWKVLEYAGSKQGPWFKCQCSCGHIGVIRGIELRRGSKSCGHNGTTYKHGFKRRNTDYPAEYSVWVGMRSRCNDPNHESYKDYGERGIVVCERWNSFELFLQDMGTRPSSNHTIERKDNNGLYDMNNCHWATRADQARNTRRTILLTFGDTTACLKDWCENFGISYNAVIQRIHKGQLVEDAFNAVVRKEV